VSIPENGRLRRIAIYCGSAPGNDPAFRQAAVDMVREMARRGIDLVYGGGKLGLMGLVADTMLEAGGRVYGVIPAALVDKEVAHTGLTELHQVAGMHERKARMTELTDAFVCLPGGIGTLDELFEAWTWKALGYHAKPFCLLNVNGFWNGLDAFMDHVSASGFLSPARRAQLMVAGSPEEAINKLDEAAAHATQGMVW
jgi:uncharacterized protein (TIGR00730 family)